MMVTIRKVLMRKDFGYIESDSNTLLFCLVFRLLKLNYLINYPSNEYLTTLIL